MRSRRLDTTASVAVGIDVAVVPGGFASHGAARGHITVCTRVEGHRIRRLVVDAFDPVEARGQLGLRNDEEHLLFEPGTSPINSRLLQSVRHRLEMGAYREPYDVNLATIWPVALVSLPGRRPCSTTLRHVAHIKPGSIWTNLSAKISAMRTDTLGTYTATCVVYVLILLMRTLARPGPLGESVVVSSARRMRVLPFAYVKFLATAVAWSTY